MIRKYMLCSIYIYSLLLFTEEKLQLLHSEGDRVAIGLSSNCILRMHINFLFVRNVIVCFSTKLIIQRPKYFCGNGFGIAEFEL